jgi:hypothetical protein
MMTKIQSHPLVRRLPERLVGDPSRVITRQSIPNDTQRVARIIQRVIDLPIETAEAVLAQVILDFSPRHPDIRAVFSHSLQKVRASLPESLALSATHEALIGAYFTMEYSIESAALFNPSIVPHPDQSHLPAGSLRFIMSLRATGEGHISSIVFRSGVLEPDHSLHFDPVSEYVLTPDRYLDPVYDRRLFALKLREMGADDEVADALLGQLPDSFSYYRLKTNMEALRLSDAFPEARRTRTFASIDWLANSNYEVHFAPDHPLSERVIFPTSLNESRGIEDARFVAFRNAENQVTY